MFNGSKVRELRKKIGITMAEFGHKIGISEGYVSMLETGKRECPDGKVLFCISKELNCKPSDLTDDKLLLAFAESFARQASEPPKKTMARIIDPEPPTTIESLWTLIGRRFDALDSAVAGLGDRVGGLESQADSEIAYLRDQLSKALDRIPKG